MRSRAGLLEPECRMFVNRFTLQSQPLIWPHTHTHTIGSNHIASSQVKIYGFVYVPVIWCHVACVSVVHLREDKIIGLALL